MLIDHKLTSFEIQLNLNNKLQLNYVSLDLIDYMNRKYNSK